MVIKETSFFFFFFFFFFFQQEKKKTWEKMALGLKNRNIFTVAGSEIIRKTRPVVWNICTMLKNHGLLNHHLSLYLSPLSVRTTRQ